MKYSRGEFHIASTAILLVVAMVGISVVVPKESRVPTAKTINRVLLKQLQKRKLQNSGGRISNLQSGQ